MCILHVQMTHVIFIDRVEKSLYIYIYIYI
jgi:hypothetical protein